jgi:uncharacterized protein
VSIRARQIIAVVFLGVVALSRVMAMGAMPGDDPEPFPQEVAVAVAPAPNIYGDKPDVRIYQLISSMNTMWQQAFAAAGDEYEPPRIEPRNGQAGSDCGITSTDWAGVYCPDGERIVIDVADHLVRKAMVGDSTSDDLLGYVLAHEVGHHVQDVRGMGAPKSQGDIMQAELHAQCLAGVWGRAAGRPLPPVASYAADGDHGSVEQQRYWLERGHTTGRPAACDGAFAA